MDPKDAGKAPLKIMAQVSFWGHLHLSSGRCQVLSASGPWLSHPHTESDNSVLQCDVRTTGD